MTDFRLGSKPMGFSLGQQCLLCLVLQTSALMDGSGAWDVRSPPEGTFIEYWYIVEIKQTRAGYEYLRFSRDGDSIISHTSEVLTFSRAGTVVSLREEATWKETLAGQPLAFDLIRDYGGGQTRISGRVKDGTVTVVQNQAGQEETEDYRFSDGALMPWGQYLERWTGGFEPGAQHVLRCYELSASLESFVQRTFTIEAADPIEVEGVRHEATRILETSMGATDDIHVTSWFDGQRLPLVTEKPLGGLGIRRSVRADRAQALAKIENPPELYVSIFIPLEGPLDVLGSHAIRYRLSWKTRSASFPDLPETTMQIGALAYRRNRRPTAHRLGRNDDD